MSEYTQGFYRDGAAILKDGQPMTIEEVLEGLRYADALAVENRQLKSRSAWLDGERDALIDQKNALAAHVELLCKRWSEFLGAGDERDGAAFRMQEAVEAAPAASLARRKAEVLEEARGKHTGNRCYCAARIGKAASELRRQAEEGKR